MPERTKKRARAALAAVAAVLVLAACSGPRVEVGVVVDKHYDPSWVQMVPAGKTWIPVIHPECWSVTLEAGENRSDWCLTRSSWHDVDLGDVLDLREDARA